MTILPNGFIISILEYFNIPYYIYKNSIKVKCPFHNDENPSASIDIEKNTFICFVCKDKLYKKLNITTDKIALSSQNLFKLLGGTEQEWKYLLKIAFNKKENTYKYIKTKKLPNNININKIWDKLAKSPDKKSKEYLENRKINLEKIEKGIKFIHNRKWSIAIPLFDTKENLIGIQLRANSKDIKPKTIMYPGSKIGFMGIKKPNTKKITIIVEGSMDYLTAKSLGYTNVIGITSASQNISEELTKYITKKAIFFIHNDEAGINLYKKVRKICINNNIDIFAIKLGKDKGEDLNDFVIKNQNPKVILNRLIKKLINKNAKKEEVKW